MIMHRLLRSYCFLALIFGGIVAWGQPEGASQAGALKINSFEFRYGADHPQLPPISSLLTVSVPLSLRDGVWVASDAGGIESLTLGKLPEGSRFDASALRRV